MKSEFGIENRIKIKLKRGAIMSKKDVLKVKLVVTEKGEETVMLEQELDLINIPGMWAMLRSNPKDGEKKGYGRNRLEVILDWLYKNYGSNK